MAEKLDTPDSPAGVYLCRRFTIPLEMAPYFMGAVVSLLDSWRWEEVGTLSIDETLQEVHKILFSTRDDCMVGDILMTAQNPLPSHYLECDGATYDRVDYPDLYAVLDAAFIIDADTFSTPDMRGRVPLGVGNGAGLSARSIGDTVGVEAHQLITSEMPSHTHSSHAHGAGLDVEPPVGVPDVSASPGIPTATGSAGGDQPHENMQPSLAVRFAIIAQ